jgi:hypothetical protein
MDESTLSIILSSIALIISILSYFGRSTEKEKKESASPDISVKPLQLQAYERLVILTERISLPNLISRVNQPSLSARDMRIILLENIKQEFEYNASQQIYVTQAAWDAVRNLRDQNMLIINSIAKAQNPEASGSELNKQLLEVIMNQEHAALHTFTLNTLNSEAKKIM